MKQQIQLQIPTPCHENWDAMTGTAQGRFCMSCQKEVIDFSVMTDKEILTYISAASSNICGRVQDDQLNRAIQLPPERKHFSFAYFWSVLITSALISNKSVAQVKPPKDTIVALPFGEQEKGRVSIRLGGMQTVKQTGKIPMQINGRVVDENNVPVPSASIMVKGTNLGIATDTAGFFSLNVKGNLAKIELVVSSVGFVTQLIDCGNPDKLQSLQVEDGVIRATITLVELQMQTMGEVVVASGCSRKGKMTTGLLSTITRYTVRDSIKSILGINEVKVYPNPIPSNKDFNINFNLKEMGEYTVQFTDALGRIISGSQLSIVSKNQTQRFSSHIFQGHGIYFVSVTNKQSLKMYTAKLLVQ